MSCAGTFRQGKIRIASRRRGAVLVLTALLLIFLVTMVAFTIDVGYMLAVRSEAKRATDAAALAGAGELVNGPDAARLEAFEFLNRNQVARKACADDENWNAQLLSTGIEYVNSKENIAIQTGHWNYDALPPEIGQPDPRFEATERLPSAIRVEATQNGIPSLFGTLISGTGDFSVMTESVAGYQPRDIVVVLDFSGSMNDDSELKRITSDTDSDREPVESNLAEIWEDLGTPNYGNLVFEPKYLTITGVPPVSPQYPQITVTFRSDDVYVESTKDLSNVVMEFTDGSRQRIEGLSSRTGAFRGTGWNYDKTIRKIWVKSGSNDSNEGPGYGERFEDTNAAVKKAFGLDTTPYPYPSGGSWDSYINYCRDNSNVRKAGYKKMYGGMTLINYWLEKYPGHDDVPDLWKVRAQPAAAVKDATEVFMEYIQEVDSDDQVGLVVYNSESKDALLEHSLTEYFDEVANTVQHRQAAHYNSMTNIGAGIRAAREELNQHARTGAFKMIVLMTDGQANTSSDYHMNGRDYALDQARKAAADGYPIVTISLGNNADKNLMEAIAETTDGIHFNIPGIGSGVTDYRADLLKTFRDIANDRPLLLVK